MSNIIEYNGYQALITFSAEDSALFGKVLDIDDNIIFEIENPCDSSSIFKEVIDDYIEFCKENNKVPCKPYKGIFNVRISPELHKKAVQLARLQNCTLNSFVESAIKCQIDKKVQPPIVNIYLNSVSERTNYSNNFAGIGVNKKRIPDVRYSKPYAYVN